MARRAMRQRGHLLLERDEELHSLHAAIAAAAAGAGTVVSVEGPAGIGKTSLLSAAHDAAEAADMLVLDARGATLEREFGFGVARQLFEAPLARLESGERDALFAGVAARAAGILAATEPREVDDGFGNVHALYWLTVNLASVRPTTLLVDDAQWCDGPSLRLLAYLTRRLGGVPAAVVLAVRSGEPPTDPGVLADILEAAQPIRLEPLTLQAAGELVRSERPDAHEAFVSACHAASSGNPFLLTTLLRASIADGIPATPTGATRVTDAGAHSARRAITLRLARLLPAAAPVARAVAILGGAADVRHVAELSGLDVAAAAAAVDVLVEADVLSDMRPLSFVHPLVHAAVYNDIPAAERSLRHAAAARALQSSGASPEQIAAHLLVMEPAGDQWVPEALLVAAQAAVARGAPDPAVTYLRRALAEPPPEHRRADLLRELGQAEGRLGDPAAVEHHREALELAVDIEDRVISALLLRDALVREDRAADAVAVLASLLPYTEAGAPHRHALEIAMLAAAQLDPTGAEVLAERLPPLRQRVLLGEVDDAYSLAVISVAMGFANERIDEVTMLARRALQPAVMKDAAVWHRVVAPSCMALILAEDLTMVRETLDLTLMESERRGLLSHFVAASVLRAWAYLREGDLVAAEADARTAVDAFALGRFEWWRPLGIALLAQTLAEQGRDSEAEALIDGEPDPAERRSLHHTHLLFGRGRVHHLAGPPRGGIEDLLASGRRYLGHLAASPTLASWRSDAALESLAAGAPEVAHRLAREELALARAAGAPRAIGVALRAAGLVEGGDAGLALLREAVETLTPSTAKLELARANVDLGAAMRRSRRRSDAREPLRIGVDLARRCGAATLATRGREELAATGARPRREMITGRDALTASEGRVAEMVAGGRSNREVAQALFVTTKTIDNHLTQIYRKLGIHSRRELPAALEAEAAP